MTDQSSAGHCWQRGGWSFIWWTVSCIAGHLAVLSPVHEKCIAPCPCVKLEHCVPCLGVWYSSTQPPLTLIKVQLLALGRPCPECRAPWRGFLKQNSSSFARKKRAVSAGAPMTVLASLLLNIQGLRPDTTISAFFAFFPPSSGRSCGLTSLRYLTAFTS